MESIVKEKACSYRNDRRIGLFARRSESMPLSYAVISLSTVLLSLPLPLAISGSPLTVGVSWIACLVCAALTIFTLRSFLSAVLLLLLSSFLISYAGGPIFVAIVFGTVLGCGLYSAIVATAKRIRLIFILSVPMLSFAISFVMTQSATLSLLSNIHLIPAIAMGLGARHSIDRSRSIALFAAVSVTELICIAAVYIFIQNGTLFPNVIEYAVEYLHGSIELILRDAINRAGAIEIPESTMLQIREIAMQFINLLPGLVAIAALVIGFFVQKVECAFFESFNEDELFESASTPISASLPAALIFIVSHVLSYTSSATNAPSFIAIASENVSLILFPVLLCVGWRIMSTLPRKIGFFAVAAWIGALVLAGVMSASILTVLAFVGAFYIIFVHTDSWAKDHFAKGENQ